MWHITSQVIGKTLAGFAKTLAFSVAWGVIALRMNTEEFQNIVREKFPGISVKADTEYSRQWDDFKDPEYYSYTWFHALANAMNLEMIKEVSPEKYTELISFISQVYENSNEEIQKCIDVSFVENLFWQVVPEKSKGYWALLSPKLKDLYVSFHRSDPL